MARSSIQVHAGVLPLPVLALSDSKRALELQFPLGERLKLVQFAFDLVPSGSLKLGLLDNESIPGLGLNVRSQGVDIKAISGDPTVMHAEKDVALLLHDDRT